MDLHAQPLHLFGGTAGEFLAESFQFSGISLPFHKVICLELFKGVCCFFVHLLKLCKLATLFGSGGVKFRNHLFERGLHFGQALFRHRTVAGGTLHADMKSLIRRGFSLIPRPQFLDLCGNIRHSLCELGLVLLGLSAGDLLTQGAQIALLLCSVRTVIPSGLVIALAQFHQTLLHFCGIHTRKLFALQCGNLCTQAFQLGRQISAGLVMGFALRLHEVFLAA